jgi:hypothetical protein
MNVQPRGFLFLLALSAALAVPAFGQLASPVAGSTQVPASIPDFSGMWVHPYFPGIEPPPSGPAICRRLHQSDPEARDGGDGEKTRGHRVVGRDVSHAKQPVLALGSPLHFFPARHGDAATAARDRFPLFAQS